jgi:hypothetical protein
MKIRNIYLFALVFFLSRYAAGQNATVVAQYTQLNATANIQFFYGDNFYYSDNYNFQQNNYLRRYNLDTKKDTIVQTLNFGCYTTQNYYTSQCLIQGSIVVNGNAYVLMGSDFKKLNLSTFNWSPLQTYPSSFTQDRAAIVTDGSNYIYVWGGFSGPYYSPTYSNQLWRYDIANDSWFQLSTAPVADAGKNGVYKYPYIYFAGGNQCWNVVHRFNLLNNTWSTIPSPPVTAGPPSQCNWTKYEKLFIDNGIIYCIYMELIPTVGCTGACPYRLLQYDENQQTWTTISLANFNSQLNIGPSPVINDEMLESFYKRGDVLWFSNNVMTNVGWPSSGNNGQLNALSMKRQLNLIIDSTSCYSATDDSLTIYYRIEYDGAFNASNTNIYLADANNANRLTIATNSNFFSSNQTVQSRSKRVHSSYLSYYLRAYNVQAGDTIWSTNKFPVNFKLRYNPSGVISPPNPISVCQNQPIGVILNINNSTANSYQWYYNNVSLNGQTAISYTATQLGAYYCQLISNNGCRANSQTVNISVGPAPNAQITPSSSTTICQGGGVVLNANTGTGLSYQWRLNNNNIPNAVSASYTANQAGSYVVIVTNSGGCSSTSAPVTITVNALPTLSTTASPTTICAGSSAVLGASGANTYLWMPGNLTGSSVTVFPTSTTTFTVTGTSANGCSNTSTRTITVNPAPIISTSANDYSICVGSSTTLNATGASSYTWQPGNISGQNITVTPSVTTTYTVTGVGSNACTGTSTLTITVAQGPTLNTSATATSICVGSSTTLTASGASNYTWLPGNFSGPSITVSPTVTTTYTVTSTGANGCTSTATRTITVNPIPTITTSTNNTVVCLGASTTITASGASSYVWNPGNISGSSITVTPNATTTYTVTGTNAQGCTNTATRTIVVNPVPSVAVSTNSTVVCSGASVSLVASGANTYTWQPGNLTGSTVTVSPASSTTYTVTGASINGCTNTATISITVNPSPVVSLNPSNTSICSGSNVTINASGAISYMWQPGNQSGGSVTVSPVTTTTYTVIGYGANGCTGTSSTTVVVNPLPTITCVAVPATVCIGSSTSISALGASTYVWQPGNFLGSSISVAPSANTTYTVLGTDLNGCSNSNTVTIAVNSTPTVTTLAPDTVFCEFDLPGNLLGLPSNGTWTGQGIVGNQFYPNYAGPGVHQLVYTVVSSSGCQGSDTISMLVSPAPPLSISASSVFYCLNSSQGSLLALPTGGTWSGPGVTGNSFNPATAGAGTHNVIYTYTDSNGCSNSDTLVLTVDVCTGITEENNSSFTIFPNPATDNIIVSWQNADVKTLTLRDASGRAVRTYNVSGTQAQLSLEGLAGGVYFLSVNEEEKGVQKIIKN